MNKRICPRCYCSKVIKRGKRNGRQRYYCKGCLGMFSNKKRTKRRDSNILNRYMNDDLKVRTLARDFNLSGNTIRKIIHTLSPSDIVQHPRPVSPIMDTTYWGRSKGLLAVIDPNATAQENLVLYYDFIKHTETTLDYEIATDTVEAMGYDVISVTIDGRRGVKEMLEAKGIPVQYCQFHQLQTINQCLTRNPILPQHKELRDIALTLTRSDRITFESQLDHWHLKYGTWLRERYIDESGRNRYCHDRCRRAYFSLRRNLPNLFTYQQPSLQRWTAKGVRTRNTTSPLDGQFAVWKDKLKAHRGITHELKVKILCNFFSGVTG